MLDLSRLPNWENHFNAAIDEWRAREFDWQCANCCQWAAACVEAVTGVDPMAPERKRFSTAIGAKRLLNEKDMATRWGERLPVIPASMTQRCDIVIVDGHVGVVTRSNHTALFIENGLVEIPRARWAECFGVAH